MHTRHMAQGSGSFSYGGGGGSGGGSYNQGQMQSSYASVGDVTGLNAGSGGFQITVGGNTHLTGAVIASSADPSKNTLDTGSLTYSNLQNSASYSASSGGMAGGYSGNGGGIGNSGASIMPSGLTIPQTGHESSTTQAAIAPGTITISDNQNQDLSGLSRNASLGDQSLGTIFNPQQIENNQQAGALAGQVGMTAAGDIEQAMNWSNGSAQAVTLHAAVGAATAALGGGNALQGALGAGVSEAAIPYLQQYGASGVLAGTTLIGGLVGGGAGAATALAGTQYNYLTHPQIDAVNKACQGGANTSACQQAVATAKVQSQANDIQAQSDCTANPGGQACQQDTAALMGFLNTPMSSADLTGMQQGDQSLLEGGYFPNYALPPGQPVGTPTAQSQATTNATTLAGSNPSTALTVAQGGAGIVTGAADQVLPFMSESGCELVSGCGAPSTAFQSGYGAGQQLGQAVLIAGGEAATEPATNGVTNPTATNSVGVPNAGAETQSVLTQQIADLRATLSGSAQTSGNMGVAQIDLPGVQPTMAASSQISNPTAAQQAQGFVGSLSAPTFPSTVVPTASGYPLLRDIDSEAQILNNVAYQLGDNTSASGSITLLTERPPCASCSNVIQQFQNMYPNINLNVLDNGGNVTPPTPKHP